MFPLTVAVVLREDSGFEIPAYAKCQRKFYTGLKGRENRGLSDARSHSSSALPLSGRLLG